MMVQESEKFEESNSTQKYLGLETNLEFFNANYPWNLEHCI